MIGLDKHERFSEEAEVLLLTEALKTSYNEATRVLPSKQRITKTTVMNKVHQLAEETSYEASEEPKHLLYSKKPNAKERFLAYTDQMLASAKNPDRVEK